MAAVVSKAACLRLIGKRQAPDGSSAAENFYHWIKGSVTVKASGVPQPVYHATVRDFDGFDVSKSDLGAHFGHMRHVHSLARLRTTTKTGSSWPDEDVGFVEGCRIMPVWLRLLNPIRLIDEGSFHADGIALQLARRGLLPMAQAKQIRIDCDRDWKNRKQSDALLKGLILRAGYDGAVYRNAHEGDGDSYIAFHGSQIKSALGNSGAFSLSESNSMDLIDGWAWSACFHSQDLKSVSVQRERA